MGTWFKPKGKVREPNERVVNFRDKEKDADSLNSRARAGGFSPGRKSPKKLTPAHARVEEEEEEDLDTVESPRKKSWFVFRKKPRSPASPGAEESARGRFSTVGIRSSIYGESSRRDRSERRNKPSQLARIFGLASNKQVVPEAPKPDAHKEMLKKIESMDQQRDRLFRSLSAVDRDLLLAKRAANQAHQFVDTMLEDFRIMEHHPHWRDRINDMADFAVKESVLALREETGDSAALTVKPLAEHVIAALNLSDDDSSAEDAPAAIVLMLDPKHRQSLTVISATAAATSQSARAKAGAQWKARSNNALSMEAFQVLNTGRAILRSPHGTDDNAYSLAPLKERNGRPFGVLVSGRPAMPDDLLRAVAITAGPLLERVWKWNKVNAMLRVAAVFIRKLSPKVSSVEWETGKEPPRPLAANGKMKQWQPLLFHDGDDLRSFALELRWTAQTLYATLGTLRIKIAEHEELCASTLELLHALAPMLQEAVEEIERMPIGDPLPLASIDAFTGAYNASRLLLPMRLQEEISKKMITLDAYKLFAEMRTYKAESVPREYEQLMRGVLCLTGRRRKELPTWETIKKALSRELYDEMLELDPTTLDSAELERRWAESGRATKSLDLDAVLERAALPLQALGRWMIALRLVIQVCVTIATEEGTAGGNTARRDCDAEREDGEPTLDEMQREAGVV